MRWLSRWRHLPNKHGALNQILRTHIRVDENQRHSIPRPPCAPWCKNPHTCQVHTPQQFLKGTYQSHEFLYKDRTLPPSCTHTFAESSQQGREKTFPSLISLCDVVILSSWVPRETLTGWAGLLSRWLGSSSTTRLGPPWEPVGVSRDTTSGRWILWLAVV